MGILKDQKTRLIQTGLYTRILNPYFLSYDMVFVSLWLIRPSLAQLVLCLLVTANFHLMVRNEETHLAGVHGREYEQYVQRTGRYLPRLRAHE